MKIFEIITGICILVFDVLVLTGRLVKILLNREVSTMKSNTQNAKIEAITEKTLVLGIDVGSETHYARAFDYRGIEYSKKPFKFSNTEAGFVTFKEWILDIKERHEKDKVVLGMEPTGHYWFNLGKFLQDNEMKPVLVNPYHEDIERVRHRKFLNMTVATRGADNFWT